MSKKLIVAALLALRRTAGALAAADRARGAGVARAPGSTSSRPARCARVPGHRPDQRRRGHPGADRAARRSGRMRRGWSGCARRCAAPGSPIATSRPARSACQPDYRYAENQPPQLTGYRASNEVNVRFRDIAKSGRDPRRSGRRGRQPDQRADAGDRAARGGARRGADPRAHQWRGRGPSSMRGRSACGWSGSWRSARRARRRRRRCR